MRRLITFAPAVVLALWAFEIALFDDQNGLAPLWLVLTAVAVAAHIWQEMRRHRRGER